MNPENRSGFCLWRRTPGRHRQPGRGRPPADPWSNPRDDSGRSAEYLISLGFINSPGHLGLVRKAKGLVDVAAGDYDAVFLASGRGLCTYSDNDCVHELVRTFYEAGKVTAVVCGATCVLLRTELSTGERWSPGKARIGFANGPPTILRPGRVPDRAG